MDFEKIELAGGRAVLYRGDSLALLEAGLLKCDAIVSDPPYGIGFHHDGLGANGLSAPVYTGKIIGDEKPFDPGPWVRYAGDKKPVVLFGADHFKTRLPEGGRFICWTRVAGKGQPLRFAMPNLRGRTGAIRARCFGISGLARCAPMTGSTARQRRARLCRKSR